MSDEQPSERSVKSTLPGPLGVIDNLLARIESFMLAAGVLLMAINTVTNVITRFGFGVSLQTTEEINRILIVLITFAGIGYAARHGRHIRMSAIYDALPTQVRRWLMVAMSAITGTVVLLLALWSLEYIGTNYQSGRVLPVTRVPIWMMYVWVPIGLTVTGIQYWLTAIKNITTTDGNVYLSTAVTDDYEEDEVGGL